MKKIILVLAAALVAFSANAQLYVGGQVSLSANDQNTSWGIVPEVGYNLNDKMAVGAEFGFGNKYLGGNDALSTLLTAFGVAPDSAFSIQPYFRYTFAQVGNFSVFADAYFNFSSMKFDDEHMTGWGLGVNPGFAYAINEHFSVVGHVGNIGYSSSKYEDNDPSGEFTLSLTNLVPSVGIYYNF